MWLSSSVSLLHLIFCPHLFSSNLSPYALVCLKDRTDWSPPDVPLASFHWILICPFHTSPRITPWKLKPTPHPPSHHFMISSILDNKWTNWTNRGSYPRNQNRQTNQKKYRQTYRWKTKLGKRTGLTLSQTRATKRAALFLRDSRRWRTTVTSSTLLSSKSTISNWWFRSFHFPQAHCLFRSQNITSGSCQRWFTTVTPFQYSMRDPLRLRMTSWSGWSRTGTAGTRRTWLKTSSSKALRRWLLLWKILQSSSVSILYFSLFIKDQIHRVSFFRQPKVNKDERDSRKPGDDWRRLRQQRRSLCQDCRSCGRVSLWHHHPSHTCLLQEQRPKPFWRWVTVSCAAILVLQWCCAVSVP